MNAWVILGIAPGSDKRTIKTAYARRAKECHPEEQPEAFMALREAYEAALANATRQTTRPSAPLPPVEPEPPPSSPRSSVSPVIPIPPRVEIQETPPTIGHRPIINGDAVRKLNAEFKAFLNRARAEQKPEDLETLLGHPLLEFMEVRDQVSHETMQALAATLSEAPTDSCPLGRETLRALDRVFQWSSDYQPVRDPGLDNVYLMLDAAHESHLKAHDHLGWKWLGGLFFNFKGRISRREWLFGFVILVISTIAFTGLINGLYTFLPDWPYRGAMLIGTALAFMVTFISLTLKRSTDAGVHPAATLILGCVFPIVLLFFILGVPREHERHADPREKFTDPFEKAYWDIRNYSRRYSLRKFGLLFRKLSSRLVRELGAFLIIGIVVVPTLAALAN
ncbi:DUF805 domain-containing protein [Marinobacter nanhaiticus]|uniref:DUF805 domain-containing protein n=1 Tax=Marinobacter nanhaiticus TaxID=1305740 RepID=UPI0002C981E4|nr:DUF805 domain-containing protein [Marinobacter nanhaiticus]